MEKGLSRHLKGKSCRSTGDYGHGDAEPGRASSALCGSRHGGADVCAMKEFARRNPSPLEPPYVR